MTKQQRIETEQKKQAKKEEYREYREILKTIAYDPNEKPETRIRAIEAVFSFDDRRRELAGYNW